MKPKTLYRPKQLWMVISMCVFVNFSAFTQNDGSKDRPFTVQEAILYQDRPGSFWVKGYLSGCVRTNGALITDPNLFVTTNVALGSDPQGTTYLSVQLLAGDARNAINLVDNPINRYQPALIYGTLSRYCNIPGIRDVKTYLHFYLPNAPKSKDATLKSLKVGTETIPLIPGQLVYQARSAAFKTTEIEVVAVTNNYYATIVQGNGKHPLEIGENTIRIVVIAEDHTEKVYEVHLIRLCNAPEITRQPAETPACRGSNHTFQVRATGDQISYQWLKDDVIIPDATNN